MNWIKLAKDYPLAYKHMEDNFKCLHTKKSHPVLTSQELVDPLFKAEPTITVKHPLLRDLYSFFDKEGIIVSIEYESSHVNNTIHFFDWEILYDDELLGSDLMLSKQRVDTETEAFTKAFEILELRLTKE